MVNALYLILKYHLIQCIFIIKYLKCMYNNSGYSLEIWDEYQNISIAEAVFSH